MGRRLHRPARLGAGGLAPPLGGPEASTAPPGDAVSTLSAVPMRRRKAAGRLATPFRSEASQIEYAERSRCRIGARRPSALHNAQFARHNRHPIEPRMVKKIVSKALANVGAGGRKFTHETMKAIDISRSRLTFFRQCGMRYQIRKVFDRNEAQRGWQMQPFLSASLVNFASEDETHTARQHKIRRPPPDPSGRFGLIEFEHLMISKMEAFEPTEVVAKARHAFHPQVLAKADGLTLFHDDGLRQTDGG